MAIEFCATQICSNFFKVGAVSEIMRICGFSALELKGRIELGSLCLWQRRWGMARKKLPPKPEVAEEDGRFRRLPILRFSR